MCLAFVHIIIDIQAPHLACEPVDLPRALAPPFCFHGPQKSKRTDSPPMKVSHHLIRLCCLIFLLCRSYYYSFPAVLSCFFGLVWHTPHPAPAALCFISVTLLRKSPACHGNTHGFHLPRRLDRRQNLNDTHCPYCTTVSGDTLSPCFA